MEPLHKIGIFSALSDSQLEALSPDMNIKLFDENEIILEHGENSTSVYFILEGAVRATTFSLRGKEICFQQLESGEMFGELSAVDNLPRTTSIIAASSCKIGILKAKQLWQLMEQHPQVMTAVLKRLTALIRFLCSRVYEYGALGTRERTRLEIVRMAKDNMVDAQKAIIQNMPTHENIANRIASHREAVTKEFSYLSKAGLIEKKGKMLIIPDIEALSETITENLN